MCHIYFVRYSPLDTFFLLYYIFSLGRIIGISHRYTDGMYCSTSFIYNLRVRICFSICSAVSRNRAHSAQAQQKRWVWTESERETETEKRTKKKKTNHFSPCVFIFCVCDFLFATPFFVICVVVHGSCAKRNLIGSVLRFIYKYDHHPRHSLGVAMSLLSMIYISGRCIIYAPYTNIQRMENSCLSMRFCSFVFDLFAVYKQTSMESHRIKDDNCIERLGTF